jgi:diguanylate cyclase (GGDEF)-like protein
MPIGSPLAALSPSRRSSRRSSRRLMVEDTRHCWFVLIGSFGLLGLVLVAYFVSLLVRPGDSYWTWLDGWTVCGFEFAGSLLCIIKGVVRRPGRVATLSLGIGLLAWAIGDTVRTAQSIGGATPPSPSLADAFYLAFYPLAYVAVVLFMRSEVKQLSPPKWLDGIIAGLGAAAVCGAFAFHGILKDSGSSPLGTVTNLAYPVGDLLLLSLVIGGCAVLPGRRRAPWILLASGITLNVAGDTANLLQRSFGATRTGFIIDAIAWPAATLLMSLGVWLRTRPSNPLTPPKATGFSLPILAAGAALVILVVGSVHSVSRVAIGLSAATLLVVGIRLLLSVREIQTLSHERHRQAVTDDLTGLSNRRHLFRVLDSFFTESDDTLTPGRNMAFLFIDLNHFKEVNDSFGHPAGDELLRQVGARLSSSLRDEDLLVRIGGDEFAVVLIDGDAAYAEAVAQRVTASLAEPFMLEAVSASISASIGIAMAPADATYGAGLVWCADVAMYRAKLGNIPFATFERALDEEGDQMRLLEELQAAIAQGDLVLHYQPQLTLRTGEILAVEALLRWGHPRLGLLPPGNFLPIAEEAGLMGQITEWVLNESATQCTAWRQAGRPLTIAVNVSPSTLLAPGFVETVRSHLARHDLPAESLVLELTESSVMGDLVTAGRVIADLQTLGVLVSIDDFGAGVTSLAYLSSLAVSELKLDRAFLAGLLGSDSERECDLVRSTIELGHAMGLRIVAEGIEDRATLELLSKLGCDVAQGYFISRPKPASQLVFRPQFSAARPPSALGRGADSGADPGADPGYFGLERRGLAR